MGIKYKFTSFLKKKGLWEEYEREYRRDRGSESNLSLKLFFKRMKPIDWVMSAFTWCESEKGHAYWSCINQEWIEYYKRYEKEKEDTF